MATPNSCPGRSARPCSAHRAFALRLRKKLGGDNEAACRRETLCRRVRADRDAVLRLGPGFAVQRPVAASLPESAGPDAHPGQPDPDRVLYRLILRAFAGRDGHPTPGIQED